MKYLILSLVFISGTAVSADKDCFYTNLAAIQAQSNGVLVRVVNSNGGVWKKLGDQGDSKTMSFQSLAQQALNENYKVMFRFKGADYNCNQTDYAGIPLAFRLYK